MALDYDLYLAQQTTYNVLQLTLNVVAPETIPKVVAFGMENNSPILVVIEAHQLHQ